MMQSPLRYPGGKSDFLAVVAEILCNAGLAGRHVVEPYAGSAAVSLGLLDLGLTPRVTLLERDPLIYSFWKAVFTRLDDLIVAFQELPITLETWRRLQPLLAMDKPVANLVVEMGVAGLFFNRANFSGIMHAGPIGGHGQKSAYAIDCRTNKDSIIGMLLALSMFSSRVSVQFGDAVELIGRLESKEDLFVYADPPYFVKGPALYRYHYGVAQHRQLASALAKAKFKWLLSYDDHHVIEFLYSKFSVQKKTFRYSASQPKSPSELLISNFDLPSGPLLGHSVMPRRQRH
jgi:DNA adenine methylase